MFQYLQQYQGKFWHKSDDLGFSGPQNDHLLWQRDNIWLMDNHRLAMWCWMQNWRPQVNFLHLDAHYDCAPVDRTTSPANIEQLSLQEYRTLKNENGEALIQWDNYLTHFQHIFLQDLSNNVFFTHHIGKPGQFTNHFDVWDLIPMLDQFFGHPEPWIVNLDLDYFYSRKWKGSPLIAPEAIRQIARILKEAQDDNRIQCLTIAMSPECVGGWSEANKITEQFLLNFFNP